MESGKRISVNTVVFVALCVGFIGGYGGFWVARWQSATSPLGVVRASRIELVSPDGKIFSTLAQDPSKGSAGMSFYDENGRVRTTMGLQAAERLPSGQWSKYAPAVVFFGNDGGARLELLVDNWDKPVMYMGSAEWERRVVLGHGGISTEGAPPGDSPVWELGFTTVGRAATTLIGTTEAFESNHPTSFIGLSSDTHSLAVEPVGVRKLR